MIMSWIAKEDQQVDKTLFFIHLGNRHIHVAGVTPHPNEAWIVQVARNVTREEWSLLSPGQYLIHERDTKFCAAFQQIIDEAGVERVVCHFGRRICMRTRS